MDTRLLVRMHFLNNLMMMKWKMMMDAILANATETSIMKDHMDDERMREKESYEKRKRERIVIGVQ